MGSGAAAAAASRRLPWCLSMRTTLSGLGFGFGLVRLVVVDDAV